MKYTLERKPENLKKCAQARCRNVATSHKDALEVTNAIRGLRLDAAESFLNDVMAHKRAVPYKKKNQGVAHRAGMGSGKYSDRTVGYVLEILKNAKANAQNKGFDISKTFVTHTAVHRGLHRRPRGSRVFAKGPSTHSRRSNIEVMLEERQ